MTTAALHSMQLPRPIQEEQVEPLLASDGFSFRRVFYPMGFAVEIETNQAEILAAAEESWGEQDAIAVPRQIAGALKLRVGVTPSSSSECPPKTSVRANGHLLSIIADIENFSVCDLQQGVAFGWVTEAALHHRHYLRYHFLEATVMCLLTGSRVTPVHAACVSLNGFGLLLCGESGAGKSTLAYACARAGWALTTDDASYVVWHSDQPHVRGNAHQVRFRPSARDLFPEIRDRELTPRTDGKPSIEVPTSELPGIVKAPQAVVHAILLLKRRAEATVELREVDRRTVLPHLEGSLYPLEGIRQRQAAALTSLDGVALYEFHYRDLDCAIAQLEALTEALAKTSPEARQTDDNTRTFA
ncbi:HPr(Ser) kinase/phosphatase [Granulicella tundricola]|uniref:HPr(Ser) kinase/phosphatase n=1 Tax=Granulicella tundricola (strain ATCC BAA-1859 / DSM 23138 / MP5ACTX9) TaxID=1198114 RepID=E8WYQ2_GRATM|nr:HPr(Ser) kinase/phosphatase [Granulicella tundricola]ADW67650.1 HPr(Ser) kinase/phosphatase [Granulicella tundricola MP5ACTX9]